MKKIIAAFLAAGTALSASLGASATEYTNVYFEEGVPKAIINGEVVDLEGVAPIEINGKMMVPLRVLAEKLGKTVEWEDGFVAVSDGDYQNVLSRDYWKSILGVKELDGDMSDMNTIVSRLKTAVKDDKADPSVALSAWREDGSFEGIEYFDSTTNIWNASEHLNYLRTMVKAAYSEGNLWFGNTELKDKIAKSISFWVNGGRVECDNWWYKQIGIPNIEIDILLLEPEELTGETLDVFNAEALEGSIFKETITDRIKERPVSSSGGNLTDKLLTSFKIAAATKNQEEMYRVMALLDNELRVFTKIRDDEFGEDAEGIKADYSFHQHVDQVQFGGYGENFASAINQILNAAKGTRYRVTDRALNEYSNYILDGLSRAYQGEYKDFTVTGRGLVRQDKGKGIRKTVKTAMEILAEYPQLSRFEELKAVYSQRFENELDSFAGNRQFWLSDYMSQSRPGYHIGIKVASNRTKLGEVINDENLLGYYLSDGVTCIMRRGDEYDNIYPVWDWNKLPGTTTPQGGLKNLNDWAEWNGEHLWNWKGNCSFVGGVSDGHYGAAVMDYNRDGMVAHKSWFLFDDEMVALGNGINSYTDMDIYTNMNQCLKNGDVIIAGSAGSELAEDGVREIPKNSYVWHDGIAYFSEEPMELTLERRTGKWSAVNGGNTTGEETKNVFQLGIHHGVKPNNDSYNYRLLMGKTKEEAAEYAKNNSVRVLRNDDKVQAVYHDGLKMAQIIMWKMGSVELPGGLSVTANKKCMLIVQEKSDGSLSITASNPENLPKDLWITVNRSLPILKDKYMVNNEDGSTTIKFRLNESVYAGSSTVYNSKNGFDKNSIMNQY